MCGCKVSVLLYCRRTVVSLKLSLVCANDRRDREFGFIRRRSIGCPRPQAEILGHFTARWSWGAPFLVCPTLIFVWKWNTCTSIFSVFSCVWIKRILNTVDLLLAKDTWCKLRADYFWIGLLAFISIPCTFSCPIWKRRHEILHVKCIGVAVLI